MVDGVRKDIESQSYAMLWLVAYSFMLRVPSEALKMKRGGDGTTGCSVIVAESDKCIALHLASRKNRQRGSVVRRLCTCKQEEAVSHPLCVVHTLWNGFFAHMQPGDQPWAVLTPGEVNQHLRATLRKLGVRQCACVCNFHYYSHFGRLQTRVSMAPMTSAEVMPRTCKRLSIHW